MGFRLNALSNLENEHMEIKKEDILPFVQIKTARSGGSGGQHVNKVSSKVLVILDVLNSSLFTPEQKERIQGKLHKHINSNGEIQVSSQRSRSQLLNKEEAMEKLLKLLNAAFIEQKARKKTKPTKGSVQRRLEDKRKLSLKKIARKGWND